MLSSIVTVFAFVGLSSALLEQSIGIRGQLICGNQPSRGDTLKLINHNTIEFDNEIASGTSDDQGFYQLSGDLSILKQVFTMNARLKITTNCNTAFLNPCSREITLGIPDRYVSRADSPSQLFDGGVLQLQFKFDGENHKCL